MAPINPYGASKMMAERVLVDLAAATGLRYAILRYFNVAGADARGTDRRGHARQLASDQARLRDGHGAAARHVRSTAPTTRRPTAPACATMSMSTTSRAPTSWRSSIWLAGGASLVANCGYGHGFCVREVLDTARRVTGVAFPIEEGPRRPGDPAVLVADSRRIQALLGWVPRHDDLDYIVATAWRWEQRLRAMRADR